MTVEVGGKKCQARSKAAFEPRQASTMAACHHCRASFHSQNYSGWLVAGVALKEVMSFEVTANRSLTSTQLYRLKAQANLL